MVDYVWLSQADKNKDDFSELPGEGAECEGVNERVNRSHLFYFGISGCHWVSKRAIKSLNMKEQAKKAGWICECVSVWVSGWRVNVSMSVRQ